MKDPYYPGHGLFKPIQSDKRLRLLRAEKERHRLISSPLLSV